MLLTNPLFDGNNTPTPIPTTTPTTPWTPTPTPPSGSPHIISVIPPSGSQLDATEPLTVQITFSEPVSRDIPSMYDALRTWLKNSGAISLQDITTPVPVPAPALIYPLSAYFSEGKNQLTFNFFDIIFGHVRIIRYFFLIFS